MDMLYIFANKTKKVDLDDVIEDAVISLSSK